MHWLTHCCLEATDCTYYCLPIINSNPLRIFKILLITVIKIKDWLINHSFHLLFLTCMTYWVLVSFNLQTNKHALSSTTVYIILRSHKPIDTHRSLWTSDRASAVFSNKLTEFRMNRDICTNCGLSCCKLKKR